jgi:benzylsuccinate CoA-transferase BbsF subunit
LGSIGRLPGGEGALSHVRICDLSGQLAGAGATRLLAAFGAQVIRVEDPTNDGAWDLLRVAGPFPGGVRGRDRSASFNNHNVGKLGVTINLRTDEGRRLLRELIAVSDVVTENFAAGVFARLGFPYEVLREIDPSILYVSNSGFGSSGPYASFKSWGPIVQAFCGITYLSKLAGQPPAGWGYSYMDHLGAYYMAVAVLAGLVHRDRTGEGQWIDMACTEAGANLLGPLFLDLTVNDRRIDEDPVWSSNRAHSPRMAPHGVYPAVDDDRWVAIACRDDDDWRRLAELIAEPWAGDRRFSYRSQRDQHEDELDRLLGEWASRWHHDDLVTSLRQAGVPASSVASPQERIDQDPSGERWGLWPEVVHRELGRVRVDGLPVHLSETDWAMTAGAPCLGEHNDFVFCELLGYSPEQLAELVTNGVV